MRMSAAALLVVSLAAVVAAGPMKLYEKSPDETYKQGETWEGMAGRRREGRAFSFVEGRRKKCRERRQE